MRLVDQRRMRRRIKTLRKLKGWSQKDLAEALGVSRRTVQYIESGNGQREEWPCVPRQNTLEKFAQLEKKYGRKDISFAVGR